MWRRKANPSVPTYDFTRNTIMFSFISKLFLSKPFRAYCNLSDNLVESENYEIRKLINGPVDGVLFSKETSTILVQAGDHLWKINEKGHVIDTLERRGSMYSSGLCLKDDYYIDWVLSGDKEKKKYSEVIDANNMPEDELTDYLDSADIVEFKSIERNDKEIDACFLKMKDGMVVLDITKHSERIDTRCDHLGYSEGEYEKIGWHKTCLDGYEKKYRDKLILLGSRYIDNWHDKNAPIFVQKFARGFYCFEEGFWLWLFGNILGRTILSSLPGSPPSSYWFGDGYFQLNHNSENLNFKSFVSNEEKPIDFDNFSMYSFPEGHKIDMAIIGLGHRPNSYLKSEERLKRHYEKDVGLYALRRKTNYTSETPGASGKNNITFGQRSSYHTSNPWQPVFTGMEPSNSTWGDINFYNSENESQHYLLSSFAVPVDLHAIPKNLSFNWSGVNKKYAFKLYINDGEFFWYYHHKRRSDVFLDIYFDESEIVEAFQKLDSRKHPIKLEMCMEEIDKVGASLFICLRNNKESIFLKGTTFKYAEPGFDPGEKELAVKFEESKLWIEFRRALSDRKYLQDYIDVSRQIAENSPYAKDHAVLFIYHALELFNVCDGEGNNALMEKIFYHYVDSILPYAGMESGNEEVALNVAAFTSNSLALALSTHNDALSTVIFEKLLGPDFNITELKNVTLVFNLACYYAVHKQKPQLLEATKEALRRGKKADQFMSDSDFKDYWNDVDFMNVFEVKSNGTYLTKT